MAQDVQKIIESVANFVESSFSNAYEVYDITYKSVNKKMVLEVMIDSPEGIKVEDCAIVSRALSEYMDEVDLIHRTYTLEVSSPGVERILKRVVDFERHIGKLVKWTLKIEDESEKKEVFRARLQEFTDGRIVVSLDKSLREFPIDRVVEARAILEFPPRLKQG